MYSAHPIFAQKKNDRKNAHYTRAYPVNQSIADFLILKKFFNI